MGKDREQPLKQFCTINIITFSKHNVDYFWIMMHLECITVIGYFFFIYFVFPYQDGAKYNQRFELSQTRKITEQKLLW